MKIHSRRNFIRIVAAGIFAYLMPWRQAIAADKAALLVTLPGTLDGDLKKLKGKRVCGGARVNALESGYPERLRQLEATIISIPMAERIQAFNTGVCNALLFASPDKSNNELEQEIKIFFPPLAHYEFTPFPTQ
jgi:hypothetical protein